MSNNNILIWDVDQQKVVLTLTGHTSTVAFVKMLSDGQTLVSTSYDFTIKLWNIYNNGTLKQTLTGHTGIVYSAEQLKNGYLISASADGTMKVWNLVNYNLMQTITSAHAGYNVFELKLLGNGNFASSGGENNIRIWSTAMFPYTFLAIMSGHTNTIWDLELLNDGFTLASASNDKTVKLWNTNTATLLSSFNPFNIKVYYVKQVSISPIVLACVGNTNQLVYYNTQTNTKIQTDILSISSVNSLVVFNSTLMFAGGGGTNQMQICFLNNYANLGSSYLLAAGSQVYWLEKLSMIFFNYVNRGLKIISF